MTNRRTRSAMRCRALAAVLWLPLAAVSLSAATMLDEGERPSPLLPNFQQVNAHVYRGAQPRPGGLRELCARGIKSVINLRADDARSRSEGEEARSLGLRYYNVAMSGWSRPKDAQIEAVLRLLDDPANLPAFVHCKRGKERTGTAIACYRISHDHWDSRAAKAEANRYGMSRFEFGMKDYIHDFGRRRGGMTDEPTTPPRKQAEGRGLILYSVRGNNLPSLITEGVK